MTDELRLAIEHAQRLPEESQRNLAAQIEAWLDEQEWNTITSSPAGQLRLAKLVAEGREEISRGEVEDRGFGR